MDPGALPFPELALTYPRPVVPILSNKKAALSTNHVVRGFHTFSLRTKKYEIFSQDSLKIFLKLNQF